MEKALRSEKSEQKPRHHYLVLCFDLANSTAGQVFPVELVSALAAAQTRLKAGGQPRTRVPTGPDASTPADAAVMTPSPAVKSRSPESA